MARVIETFYPTRCLACGFETSGARGLCQTCWAETHFITGTVCDSCGVPLPDHNDADVFCDRCLSTPPAWDRGRAAVLYEGAGRKMTLLLKHSDRLDLVPEMARWMYQAGQPLFTINMMIAPVPLHPFRLIRRRFNQAAVLARQVARLNGMKAQINLLRRIKPTAAQKGMNREDRFENLNGAIAVNKTLKDRIKDRSVLLIDDVMTTGATLSICADVCKAAGAKSVHSLVFARVARME